MPEWWRDPEEIVAPRAVEAPAELDRPLPSGRVIAGITESDRRLQAAREWMVEYHRRRAEAARAKKLSETLVAPDVTDEGVPDG